MNPASIALLEFDGVAAGVRACDAMVKRAPIALLKAGTVHPGRFLALLGGSVASVEEAWRIGLQDGRGFMIDDVFLPDVDRGLLDGVMGRRCGLEEEALGVLETNTVAALLRAADAGAKGADVRIAEVRLADDLGGRAFVFFDGPLTEVETALEIGFSRAGSDRVVHRTILPRLDADLRRLLSAATRFGPCAAIEPDGAEKG